MFNLLSSLAVTGVTLIIIFLVVAALFPGDNYLEKVELVYLDLWTSTTGEEFTPLVRANPWVYIIPAVGIMVILASVLPQKEYGRAALMYAVFGLGFLAGHFFW